MPPTADPPEASRPALLRQRAALVQLAQLDVQDLAAALPRILEISSRTLEVERASLWVLEADRSRLCCRGLYRASDGAFESGAVLNARDYPAYFSALLTRQPIRVDHAANDPRTREFQRDYFPAHGITSMLDVPVWHRGKLAGVLCHEHVGPPRIWTLPEQEFLVCVGMLVTSGLEAKARRHAEVRYDLLGRATQHILYDLDVQDDRIEWSFSPGALGYQHAQIHGSLAWWSDRVHPDDAERVTASLTGHIQSGHGQWREEYRFSRADGTFAVILDRGFLERDAQGRPVRLVGSMMEVTEQRQLEARVMLTDRLASVGTLAAGVAHEINNPLSFIQANVQYAIETLPEGPVNEALREAAEGVDRVRRIVRDLKTFARPDVETRAPVDLRTVVETALAMAANELRHRATVHKELSAVPPVFANEARLGQVALNLLVNAAQALPAGGQGEHRITVRTFEGPGDTVNLEVSDTGHGVSPDVLRRVFDPFFTTKPVGEGTGIGLSISHAIVSELGGTLTLENNRDRGCTARVVLPAGTGQAVPAPPEGSRPQARARGAAPEASGAPRPRVLIIDDEPQVASAIRRILARRHDVTVHTRAPAALEQIASGTRYDAILCDLMMPELSGQDFLAALERLAPDQAQRVIIITGGAFTPRTREFLATTRLPVLEKPFDGGELEALLGRVLAAAAT